ncbi:MAG: hypothetical protein IPM92_14745 [Saprospiraceae bacterium]|nr:hypothetical protein [Saprospiraceae bacterium]
MNQRAALLLLRFNKSWVKWTLVVLCYFGLQSSTIHSKQWLVIYAKEGFFNGLMRQSFGHIYVGMIQEDPKNPGDLLAGFWGYYPRNGIRKEGVWGYMDGSIRNDWGADYQHSFAVQVNDSEFMKCLQLIQQWDQMPYSLRARNCIDFIRQIVKSMTSLKDPDGFYLLPNAYIEALRDQNRKIEFTSDFSSYKKVVQVTHYDGRLAKKFFVLTKWKAFMMKHMRLGKRVKSKG